MQTISQKLFPAVLAIALAGCSSIPKDYGRSEIDSLLSERGIPVKEIENVNVQHYVESIIASPLTVDSVTRLALINNADLKKAYARLGFAAAEVYEAGRIRNPIFSYAQLDSNQSGERDLITLSFIVSLADLITLPARKNLADAQFSASKQSIGAEILQTMQEVQSAYYDYLAAEQVAQLYSQMHKTAQLSSQLAQRYHQAGNMSDRELLEESAKESEAKFESLDANSAAQSARKNLANLVGLAIEDPWRVENEISLPSAEIKSIDELLVTAQQSRLDLVAAHLEADRQAKNLGVTNWTRFLGDLDVGVERERETDGAKLTGPVLEWEVPIFTQHNDAKLRAASELQIAIAEVARLRNTIHNEVRVNFSKVQGAQARVHEYGENYLPTKSALVSRAQEEENFMLIGTFELLDIKQEEYASYVGYIEGIHNYWIVHTNLMYAVGDSLAVPSLDNTPTFSVKELLVTQNTSTQDAEHTHH